MMVANLDRNEADDWAANFNTGIPYPNSHICDLAQFERTERHTALPRWRRVALTT